MISGFLDFFVLLGAPRVTKLLRRNHVGVRRTGGHNETEMKYVIAQPKHLLSQKCPSRILLSVIPEP